MRLFLSCILAVILCYPAAAAPGWLHYANQRYGYSIDIPPGFSAIQETAESGGGISEASDGAARLMVWTVEPLQAEFEADVAGRIAKAQADGWQVSYQRETHEWAAWAGTMGTRSFFARAVPLCDTGAAYFRLEYDRADAAKFNPLVARLANSMRGKLACG